MSNQNKEMSPESAMGIPQEMIGERNPSLKSKRIRGFAGMDEAKKRTIASLGGKAAHIKGTAHQFTHEEAKAAGKKGGEARSRKINNEKLMRLNRENGDQII